MRFISQSFNEDIFVDFLSQSFFEFEKNISSFEDICDEKIKAYKFLGQITLDDRNDLGFFIVQVNEDVNIENTKVSLNKKLTKFASDEELDGAIAVFYNPFKQNIWRLSFISFSYNDEHKKVFSNLRKYTYVLGENIPIKTASEQLSKFKNIKSIENLQDIFSVERVTSEFYKGLINLYEQLIDTIVYPDSNENDKREFAIRLLGRILFIKFLNKKDFVPNSIFEVCDDYYHEILEPLFFQKLNKSKDEREQEFKDDKIPFLNGGLFETLHVDKYKYTNGCSEFLNTLKIKDEFFIELFTHLDQFNFTIDENSIDDHELSIDPEMLGRIFENLLAELNDETKQNARKATGSYYTPREIVDYMVNSSLLQHLKSKTNIQENDLKSIIFKDTMPQDFDDKLSLLGALCDLKIIDPACGSGAFPMGILQKIIRILSLVDEDGSLWFDLQSDRFKSNYKNRNKDYMRKLSIIKNSIYGVDIQSIAIEISKLRFFLSLVVEEDGEPEPLPNLEFKFVCANSLLPMPKKPTEENLLYQMQYKELEEKLKELKSEYFESFGKRKNQIKNEYKQIQQEMLKVEKDISLLEYALNNDLINYDPFNPLSVANFFDSNFMFNVDGFDIIIGNPPYIKEYTNKKVFEQLKTSDYYQGKMDIWYFFGCIGIDLLRQNGILSFIATNNWISNAGASKLRNKILNETKIIEFIDFGDYKVFENAGIQTMILTIGLPKSDDTYKCQYLKLVDKHINKQDLIAFLNKEKDEKFSIFKANINSQELENKNITFLQSEISDLLETIKTQGDFVLDEKEVIQGIVGAPDKAFIVEEENYDDFNEHEKLYLKNFHTNCDRFYTKRSDKYIFYTNKKNLKSIEQLNNFNDKLLPFKQQLQNRREVKSGQIKYFHLQWARNEEFFKKGDKIICNTRTAKPSATFTRDEFYASRALNIIKTEKISMKYLTAILNSKISHFWLKYMGKLTGDLLQIDKSQLLSIPIKKIDNTKPFEILVDYIRFIKTQDLKEFGVKYELMPIYFEQILDGMIYELYFEDLLKSKNRNIMTYLEDLESLDNIQEDKRISFLFDVFTKLNDTKHKVRNNLFYMNSINEIKIIEGAL